MNEAREEKLAVEDGVESHMGIDKEERKHSIVSKAGELVNASGHKDQLQRQYGLLSICGFALNVDNAWTALGTSVSIAIGESPVSIQQMVRNILIMCRQRTADLLESYMSSLFR